MHAGPDGRALARYLEANEIEVEIKKERPAVMLGSGCWRLLPLVGWIFWLKALSSEQTTQMIFGGATRAILDQAQIPVIFAH